MEVAMDKMSLEKIFHEQGMNNFKWLPASEIKVEQWVRFKCRFGCHCYGKKQVCPPNVPNISECREFIEGYQDTVIFEFAQNVADREERRAYCRDINQQFYELERQVFLAGYYKVFALYCDPCNICGGGICVSDIAECRDPIKARPSPEGIGIDVFSTAQKAGFNLQVLKDHSETMKRYAIMLIN